MTKKWIFLLCASIFFMNLGEAKIQQTLSIIKPDAVKNQHIGEILATFEKNGLQIVALKMTRLTKSEAEQFYSVHKDRAFYKDLVEYMISGPIVVQVLKGDNAVSKNRELMGSTDPKSASSDTIRGRFGIDVQQNAVHGSDSEKNAEQEISFFFSAENIFNKSL